MLSPLRIISLNLRGSYLNREEQQLTESFHFAGECQANFYLTSLPHHVIKSEKLRIDSSREAEGPTL
jgi:hypothetical protein